MLQFNFCHLVLTCILFCTAIIITASSSTITFDQDESNHNETKQNNNSNGAIDLQQPTALPLYGSLKALRYRRQHPSYTIVKHVLRTNKRTKPRRRVKRPKIKYGPPNYNFGEPISYYKPSFSHPDESVGDGDDGVGGETIYPSLNHFNGLHIEGSDFELPPSSYEAQSMDVDFYNHKSPSYSYPTKSKPYNQYEEEPVPEVPAYHEANEYVDELRKPHRTYGLPKDYAPTDDYHPPYESLETLTSVNEDFNKSPTYSQHLEQGHYEPSSKNSYHSTSSTYDTYSPPATKYGVPVLNHKPNIEYNPTAVLPPAYHTPNFDENPYALYDKSLPNAGHANSEPNPQSYESQGKYQVPGSPNDSSNIQITYSPSYEINIPENTYGGNFAEPPPAHVDHPYGGGSHDASHPTHATSDYTVEPSTQHHITTDHYQQESESEDSTRYLRPKPELPLNQHQNRPTYDYPKTSYQVPIYDPAPFGTSHAHERDEKYPPHISITTTSAEPPSSQAPASAGGRNRVPSRQRPRKKNRVRGTTSTSTTSTANKHILDVPELEQAFEADNRKQEIHNKYVEGDPDADVNESNQVEERHRYGNSRLAFTPTVLPDNNNPATNHVWDPMRVRTKTTTSTTTTSFLGPFSLAPTKATSTTNANNTVLKRRKHLLNRRPLGARGTLLLNSDKLGANVKNMLNFGNDYNQTNEPISIISIEKSHSQSYYDGTISPPSLVTSKEATISENTSTKRTTNSIFDTTVFKSPHNNYNYNNQNNHNFDFIGEQQRQLNNNLPKNHKYF